MTQKRYVVAVVGGLTYQGIFFPQGASLYLADPEYQAFPRVAALADPDAVAPASASFVAAGIAQGDEVYVRRDGVVVRLASGDLAGLAAFLAPLVSGAVIPTAPSNSGDTQSGALLPFGLL